VASGGSILLKAGIFYCLWLLYKTQVCAVRQLVYLPLSLAPKLSAAVEQLRGANMFGALAVLSALHAEGALMVGATRVPCKRSRQAVTGLGISLAEKELAGAMKEVAAPVPLLPKPFSDNSHNSLKL
jgi:hypothetical protein